MKIVLFEYLTSLIFIIETVYYAAVINIKIWIKFMNIICNVRYLQTKQLKKLKNKTSFEDELFKLFFVET